MVPKLVQLPKINELIDEIMITNCKYFSVSDLRAGYYQVKLHKSSRPLTAFTAPSGMRYMYSCCPFGLNTSPAAMLTVLTNLFAGQRGRIYLYMDDVLTVGGTWQDHLKNLRIMFQIFAENCLTCNPTKCEFAYTEIEYLGFRLSDQGVRISERKIEAIKAIQPPANKKALQRVLGIFCYWRRYIRNFAQRTANMRQLLLKDNAYKWTPQCQEEFEYLKECLMRDPILKPINPNKDVVIMTDACTTGYSYVLMQYGSDEKLHVVSYGAQATTRAQSRYVPAELELVAVALALKSHEVFLLHKGVTIVSDNTRVLHLKSWPAVNERQRRLLTYLMQFRLTIKYIRGSKNLTADALSRIFEDMTEQERQEYVPAPTNDEFVVAVHHNEQDALELTEKRSNHDEEQEQVEGASDRFVDAFPITSKDYEQDEEFRDMFVYLTTGNLTGNEKTDKTILLLADQYFLENDILFRLTIPRNKRVARVSPVSERLCVPKKYRFDILSYHHNNLGHPGVQRLFRSLSQNVYWKNLFYDVHEFCTTCDLCLRTKRYFGQTPPPLHPFFVPSKPFDLWALDHKVLSRKTEEGNVAILCCLDVFSGWPVLQAVKDVGAVTTAKVFFRHVVSVYGAPARLMTDKAPSFLGTFFSQLTKLLNISHRTSAATVARSNGAAESLVKRVSELLKIYATDDTKLDEVLPIVEMSIRSTASTRTNLSPFNICFGTFMNVPSPHKVTETPSFSGDYAKYYAWLSNSLEKLHEAVKQNRLEVKQDDKKQYDKKHAVTTPNFKIGDQVLLLDTRIKAHSNRVITHRNYNTGPFYIADLVQGSDDVGTAYKLIHVRSGKSYRRLVPADRLKPYTADRTDLLARLPPSLPVGRSDGSAPLTDSGTDSGKADEQLPQGCEQAKRILRQKTRNKRMEYFVLFSDGSKAWCDYVTPSLLQHFRLLQERKRERRRMKRVKSDNQ